MKFHPLHSWDLTLAAARSLQSDLARRIVLRTPAGFSPKLVAGADVSCMRGSNRLYGAVVVLRLPEMEIVERSVADCDATFPYVPGFLSFREGPVLLKAFSKLRAIPDVIFFDAQGVAHPRRFGLASHLGLILGISSIGCAKSHLFGRFDVPKLKIGAQNPIVFGKERLGVAIRTRIHANPIYISVGHMISLTDAASLTMSCLDGRHRIPAPTRLAHLAINEYRRSLLPQFGGQLER